MQTKAWIPQNFVVGVKDFGTSTELTHFLKEYPVLGLVLFNSPHDSPSNIWNDPDASLEALFDFVKQVEGKIRLLAVDQEGGRVRRLRGNFVHLPSAQKMAEAGNSPERRYDFEKIFRLAAEQMAISGIHLNFAPVCDLRYTKSNNVIGDRSFGENAEQVIGWVTSFCKAFEEKDVLTTLKHFPGHGPTTLDSHEKAAVLFKEKRELFSSDTKVFQACAEFASAILTAHISYPELEGRIFSIDPELFQEAKKLIKGDKIWVTDDLSTMKAVNDRQPWLRALDCQYDLISCCGTLQQAAQAIDETIRYGEEELKSFAVADAYEKRRVKVRTRFEVVRKNLGSFQEWKKNIIRLKRESEKLLEGMKLPS